MDQPRLKSTEDGTITVSPPSSVAAWQPSNQANKFDCADFGLVYGASEGSFHPGFYPEPIAASEEYIENYKKEWLKAVERCKEIGFDFIEIHGAHGYLIHGASRLALPRDEKLN